MRYLSDLLGTLQDTFRVGLARLFFTGFTGPRSFFFPDKSGTVALLDDLTEPAAVPMFIAAGDEYTVRYNTQQFFHVPIIVEGVLTVDGFLGAV